MMANRQGEMQGRMLLKPGLLKLEVDEFEEYLRLDGCSPAMIARELKEFCKLKAAQESGPG